MPSDTLRSPYAPPQVPGLYGPWATGLILLLAAAGRLAYLAVQPLDLHPDEAQYWSWSRYLDWGYFSKPPMIAWLIATTTAMCGDGEACIRAGIPVLHSLTGFLIYGIARRLFDARAGFFSALVYVTLPGVSFSSGVASTDPLLLLFWALGLYALVRLRDTGGPAWTWWGVLGAAMGLGLLSKYAMAFFIAGLVLWLITDSDARGTLLTGGGRRAGLVLAAALAGLIYLPNLLWNVESGLVTFLHTGSNASLGGALLRPDKLFEFAASQFAVFGPILFAILVWRLVTLHRRWADPRERFLAWFVVTMLVPILALSFLTRANANWAAPIYVAGTIWVVATVFATGRRWPVVASVVLHLALAGVLYGGVLTATEPGTFAGMKLKPASSSFKRYRGWRKAAGAIDVIRAQHPGLPLLVDDRKTMAALLYYLRPWPVRAYAWHPGGRIGNHFALTRPWPARARGPALLVVRRRPPTYFLRHFRSAWPVATISVPIGIGTTRELRLFRVEGFLGYNSPPSARRPAKQAP